MPCEIWGTFSVSDHLRERPFVADLLLYDKSVVPVVPQNDEEVREGRLDADGSRVGRSNYSNVSQNRIRLSSGRFPGTCTRMAIDRWVRGLR